MATANSGSRFKPQNLGGVLLVGGGCARTPSGTLERQMGPQAGFVSSRLPVIPKGTKRSRQRKKRRK